MEEDYLTHEEELEIDAISEDDVDLDVEAGQRKIIWQKTNFRRFIFKVKRRKRNRCCTCNLSKKRK